MLLIVAKDFMEMFLLGPLLLPNPVYSSPSDIFVTDRG